MSNRLTPEHVKSFLTRYKDPADARKFLQEAGLIDENGNLAGPYRPDHFIDASKKADRPSLDHLMKGMPSHWAERWCDAGACACMGCANRSGGIAAHGYTRSDHARWLYSNRSNKTH